MARAGDQHFLVGRRREHVLEDSQRQVVALLLLDARPVAVVEAGEHLVDVETDVQRGGSASGRGVDQSQRLRDVLDEAVIRSVGELEVETLAGKQAIAPDGAAFDHADPQRQRIAQTPRIAETLAAVDRHQQLVALDPGRRASRHQPPEFVVGAVGEHLSPVLVATLEELPPAGHRHVLAVLAHARDRGCVSGQLPVPPVEQLRIVVAAVREREARRFARVRRQVVQGAVQIRVGRFADVDLSQQGEQPIRRPGPAMPRVEVEAVENLPPAVFAGGCVQGVDLVAVAGAGQREGERRPQVPHRDVQPAPQVGYCVGRTQPFHDLRAGYRIHERTGIVVDVATITEVAAAAGLPELLVSESTDEAVEDGARTDRSRRVRDDRAQVQIHRRDAFVGRRTAQSRQDDGAQPGVPVPVVGEEVDEPSFVDGDDPGFVRRPAAAVVSLEGIEELLQHRVVGLRLLVLAAVVVGDEAPALPGERRAVRPRHQRGLRFRGALDLLNERRLAVARVAGHGDQAEFAVEQRPSELVVEPRGDVRLPADFVQAPRAGVAARALAVHGQQVIDERVDVRPGRLQQRRFFHLQVERRGRGCDGRRGARCLHSRERLAESRCGRKPVGTASRDGLRDDLREFIREVAVELPGMPGHHAGHRSRPLPRVLAGGALVERDPEAEQIPVGLFRGRHLFADLQIRRDVAARPAGARFVVLGLDRHVEVDDADSLVGPEQVRRLDVAVIDVVGVQVFEAGERFQTQTFDVLGRKRAVVE